MPFQNNDASTGRSIFLAMQELLDDSSSSSSSSSASPPSEEEQSHSDNVDDDLSEVLDDEAVDLDNYLEEFMIDEMPDTLLVDEDLPEEDEEVLVDEEILLEDMEYECMVESDDSSSSSTYWFHPPPNIEIFRLCKSSDTITLDHFKSLIEKEGPELLQLRDSEDQTPLFYLTCDQDMPMDVLEYLATCGSIGASFLKDIPRPQALSTLMEAFANGVKLEALKALMSPLDLSATETESDDETVNVMEEWLSYDPLHECISRQKAKDDTLLFLIEKSPRASERGNWEGRLPLHLACLYGCSLAVVKALAEEYPASLLLPDVDGDLPLHLSLSRMAHQNRTKDKNRDALDVIRYLIDQSPTSLTQGNDSMQYPVHVACESGASLECIQLLHSHAPASIERQCMSGMYPLHCACSRRHGKSNNLNAIAFLIDSYPSAVRSADEDGDLPLHILLRRGEMPREEEDQYFELVQKLLSIYPEAICHCNEEEDLPLHIACEYAANSAASLRLVKKLVELNEDALNDYGDGGGLALHRVCCGTSKRLDIVSFILDRSPDAVGQADDDDDLPIHLLLQGKWGMDGNNSSESDQQRQDLVVRMLAIFPECADCTSEDDLSPFSLACKWGAPLSVVRLFEDDEPALHRILRESSGSASLQTVQRVTSLYPESIYEKNDSGELPLHAAARTGQSLMVIQALYNRNRGAITAKDARGNLPLHSSVIGNPSSSTITFLWSKYKAAAATANLEGSLPLHLVCSTEYPGFLGEIRLVAEMNLEALKRTDLSGRVPLHHYCERPRNSSKVLLYLVNQNPATCGSPDKEGNLPLHICAMNKNAYPLAVQHLVNKNKAALTIRNNDGDLPLHLYLMHRSVHDLTHLKSLSQRADKLEYRTNAGGATFLHTATACGAVKDVLKFLVQQDPDAPKMQDSQGRTPLHLARDYSAAFLLFCKYPDSAAMRDFSGNLPIHRACALREGTLGVVRCLWVCEAQSLLAKNNQGDLPIHVACEARSSRDVLEFLAEQCPESFRMRGSRGHMPLHAWFRNVLMIHRFTDPDLFFVVNQYPQGLEVADEDGLFPFQLASGSWSIGTIYDLLQACPHVICQQQTPKPKTRSVVESKGNSDCSESQGNTRKFKISTPQRKKAVPIKMTYVEAAKRAMKSRKIQNE